MTETDLTTSSLTDLAAQIRLGHESVQFAARKTVEHAVRVGELLIAAKNLVRHGGWCCWLQDNCDLSERSAQAYMKLARSKPQLSADLTIDDALKALAKPKPPTKDPVVTDAVDRTEPKVAPKPAPACAIDPEEDPVVEDVIAQCVADVCEHIDAALDDIVRKEWPTLRKKLHKAMNELIDQRIKERADYYIRRATADQPNIADAPKEPPPDDLGIPEFLRRQSS